MKKTLIFLIAISTFFTINVFGQASKLISKIESDGYSIKYTYDSKRRLISYIIFNKLNLNDVKKYTLEYLDGKIIITSKTANNWSNTETMSSDKNGRITEGTYNHSLFPYWYKLNYLPNGYLNRINYYSKGDRKLQYIHSLDYENDNLTVIKTTFNIKQDNTISFMPGTDYYLDYYDKPAIIDMNFILQTILLKNKNNMLFMGVPSDILGKRSKKLIKSITSKYNYYGYVGKYHQSVSTLEFKYDFDENGLVIKMSIGNINYVITYIN